jgi:predicted membrane protein (TIGR00267 family)
MTAQTEREFKAHFLMESVAFGLTDGVICFLGIIVGVATATLDSRMVLIAGIISGVSAALGNAIGFFVSQATERAVQLREAKEGETHHVHSKKEVTLSGVFSCLATLATVVVLIFPFICLNALSATMVSFAIGIVMAFALGMYIGKLGAENLYRSGLKYACITILGALIAYGMGELLRALL